MPLKKLDVHIDQRFNGKMTTYRILMDLGENLTIREQTILLRSATHCHVHKMLAGEINSEIRLKDSDKVPADAG